MNNLITGYLAGISVGVFCLGLCLPAFLPILLADKKTAKRSFWALIEFSLGRLLGYLFFGLIFGWLGQIIQSRSIHLIVALVNLWMGIALIVYSLGKIDQKFCALIPFKKIRWPLLIGFLTGVNVCPPFVASLTYVFNLKSALKSLIYFLSFFLGTSTYLLPTILLGWLSRSRLIQNLARVSGVLAGLYFASRSLSLIF